MKLLFIISVFVSGIALGAFIYWFVLNHNTFAGRLALFVVVMSLLLMLGIVLYIDMSNVNVGLDLPGGMTSVVYEPEQIHASFSSKFWAKLNDKAFVIATLNMFAWLYVAYLARQL